MSRLTWCAAPAGAACLLVLSLTGTFWAQDQKPVAAKHDAAALRASLKDVINTGAALFNKYGDHAGCYRLYQGALLSVKPFLAPATQQEIDSALAEAESLPRFSDRAFALRKTIDGIRAQAAGAPAPGVPAPGVPAPGVPAPGDKKNTDKIAIKTLPKKEEPGKTLWERLGGEANVRKVVDDFAKTAAADPAVNLSRDGKYPLDEASVQHLKNQLVDFISGNTGGPLKYQGKNMKEAHKGMGITNAEYDAAGKHLKRALEKNGAKAADARAVLTAVEGLRLEIVEEKKKKDD
jgi:hemoglobin